MALWAPGLQQKTLDKLRTTCKLVFLLFHVVGFFKSLMARLRFYIFGGNLGGRFPGFPGVLADADLQVSDLVLSGMGMGRMGCLIFCQSICVLC